MWHCYLAKCNYFGTEVYWVTGAKCPVTVECDVMCVWWNAESEILGGQ